MDELNDAGALVFTGGGTGGHFFPAVALAEGARLRWPQRSVAFVGALRGIESRLLPVSPYEHILLDVEGFVGRSPFQAARAGLKLLRGRARLLSLWKRHRPWAVVGTGGYGAGPALLAARALGIPYFLHESNAQPGALIKLLAGGAAGVWCGMEAAQRQLGRARCVPCGTPVREAFMRTFQPAADLPAPWRLLVLGGSGGARALNEAVWAVAPALLDRFPDWELRHQTGSGAWPELETRSRHPRHHPFPFLEHMDQELEAARLVLTRSGASTCAELKACGRPSLMVPMPGSAGDHQVVNAQAMVAEGRAVLVRQTPDLKDRLLEAALAAMADPARAGGAPPEPNRAVALCLADLERCLAQG